MKDRKETIRLYADIARAYLKMKKVYRYNLKKVSEMDDGEVNQKCHFWYTENGLETEYHAFEAEWLKQEGKL